MSFELARGYTNFAAFGQKDFDDAIKALGLDPLDQQGILTLLMVGLTDNRVAREKAPFDHPQLCIPIGHDAGGLDLFADIPAIGVLEMLRICRRLTTSLMALQAFTTLQPLAPCLRCQTSRSR